MFLESANKELLFQTMRDFFAIRGVQLDEEERGLLNLVMKRTWIDRVPVAGRSPAEETKALNKEVLRFIVPHIQQTRIPSNKAAHPKSVGPAPLAGMPGPSSKPPDSMGLKAKAMPVPPMFSGPKPNTDEAMQQLQKRYEPPYSKPLQGQMQSKAMESKLVDSMPADELNRLMVERSKEREAMIEKTKAVQFGVQDSKETKDTEPVQKKEKQDEVNEVNEKPKPLSDSLGSFAQQTSVRAEYRDLSSNQHQVSAYPGLTGPPVMFDTYASFEKKQKNKPYREHLIFVDSRERNLREYPNDHQYKFSFAAPLKDVVEIELVSASLPVSIYNIDASNNVLHIQEYNAQAVAGTYTDITVDPGLYDSDSLVTALQQALDDQATATFTVSLNPYTKRITIHSALNAGTEIFNLHADGGLVPDSATTVDHGVVYKKEKPVYPPRSIAGVLGYNIQDYSGDDSYEGVKSVSLITHPYVLLRLTNIPGLIRGTNPASDGSYLPLFLNAPSWQKQVFQSTSDYSQIIHCTPPLQYLSFFQIEFVRFDGSLVTFGGGDHQLLFRVVTLDTTSAVDLHRPHDIVI